MNKILENAFNTTLSSMLGHPATESEMDAVSEYIRLNTVEPKLCDIEIELNNFIDENCVETVYGEYILADEALEVSDFSGIKYFKNEAEIIDYCRDNGCNYDSDSGYFVK